MTDRIIAKARRRRPLPALASALLLCAGLLAGMAPAIAANPSEKLADPALEARARALSAELRCLVCRNQSIDDSDAPLARDLRVLVRERIVAGEDDKAILDFLVARYGDFVLLRPRLTPGTALLWLSPALVLIGGGLFIWGAARRKRRRDAAPAPLTPAEEQALARRLGE